MKTRDSGPELTPQQVPARGLWAVSLQKTALPGRAGSRPRGGSARSALLCPPPPARLPRGSLGLLSGGVGGCGEPAGNHKISHNLKNKRHPSQLLHRAPLALSRSWLSSRPGVLRSPPPGRLPGASAPVPAGQCPVPCRPLAGQRGLWGSWDLEGPQLPPRASEEMSRRPRISWKRLLRPPFRSCLFLVYAQL